MKLFLDRTYYPDGTNGVLTDEAGNIICFTIELPWKDNQRRISCIPEDTYPLKKIKSPSHGICLELQNVNGRGDIQIHIANWALKELLGCIAPVSWLEPAKAGIGWASGKAVAKLFKLVFAALAKGETVTLTIRKA